MAADTTANVLTAPAPSRHVAVLLAWLVPGGGHFFLRRTIRGTLVAVSVVAMFLIGLLMRGPLFQPQSGDMLTMAIYYGGFLAHVCTGAPYFIAVALGYNQPDVAGHMYDYGSKFLVGAGLLNILAMVDAWEIATGEEKLMPKMALSHFETALLFAVFTSVVMGLTTKKTDKERIRYGLQCFVYFVVALFGIAWLMKLGHG